MDWVELVSTGAELLVAVATLAALVWMARQHSLTRETLRRMDSELLDGRVSKIFNALDFTSEVFISHPEVFRLINPRESGVSDDEVRAIACIGILVDAYEAFYSPEANDDEARRSAYDQMAADLIRRPNYLCRVLEQPANQDRWARMKRVWYHQFDEPFVDAVDRLVDHLRKSSDGPVLEGARTG